MKVWRLWLVSLAGLAAWDAPSVSAQSVVLEPVADTTISRDELEESNGQGQHLFVGATNGGALRRGLVRFPLTGIPAEARITGASLLLNASRSIASTQNIELRPLLEGWGEGTSNAGAQEGRLAAATLGDATWLKRVFPNTDWSAAGGTIGDPEASLGVQGLGAKTWSSSAMAQRVQAWLAAPANNHGWILKNTSETGTATAYRFDTREHPTAANRPKLTVSYVLPPVLTDATNGLALFSASFVDGNGNSGFGGPVGQGRLFLDSDVSGQLALGLQRGPGNLNDVLVVYLDTRAGGAASTASYTDQADGSRAAISGVSGANRSTLTFPAGFSPDYAIAYDARFGAFLFELVEGNSHTFVAQVAPASTRDAATATIALALNRLGLAPGDRFGVVATYISDTAFRSDEWFGASVPAGNPGFNPTTLVNASFFYFQTVASLCVPLDCDDDDPCTVDECTASGCEIDPEPRGTLCPDGFCDGGAVPSCLECLDALDCDDNDICTQNACVDGECVFSDDASCQADPGPEPGPEVVEPGPEADAADSSEPNPEPEPDIVDSDTVEPEPDTEVSDTAEPDPDTDSDTAEPDPDTDSDTVEPDPDTEVSDTVEPDPDTEVSDTVEPDPDTEVSDTVEPDPDTEVSDTVEPDLDTAVSDTQVIDVTDPADVSEPTPDSGDADAEAGAEVVKKDEDEGCGAGGSLAPLAWLGLFALRRRK